LIQADTLTARTYRTQADSLGELGQYEEAVQYVLKATPLYKKHELWEEYIRTYDEIARIYDMKADDTKRLEYLNPAIVEAEKLLSANSSALGDLYQQKGEVYLIWQQLDSANIYLGKAATIFQKAKDWTSDAWCQLLFVRLAEVQGDVPTMKTRLQKVQKTAETHIKDKGAEIFVSIYENLVRVYYFSGEYDKALEAGEKLLTNWRKTPPTSPFDSTQLATAYHNNAAILELRGDYEKALDYYQYSLSLRKKLLPPTSYEIAISYNNIGMLLNQQDKLRESLNYLQESLKILQGKDEKQVASTYVSSYVNMAGSYTKLGVPDSSIIFLEKAKTLLEYAPNSELPIYMNSGRAYSQKQQYDKALTEMMKAAQYTENQHQGKHPDLGTVYTEIADVYMHQENYTQALSFLQKALITLVDDFNEKAIEQNPGIRESSSKVRLLHALSLKAQALYNLREQNPAYIHTALSTYELAMTLIDQMRQSYRTKESRQIWIQKMIHVYEGAVQTSFELYQQTKDVQYLEKAFAFAEKSKAVSLLEAIRETEARQFGGLPVEITEQERTLKLDLAFYEEKLWEARYQKDSAKIALYTQYVFERKQAYESLMQTIERQYPQYYKLKYDLSVASIASIQASLPVNGILIEYFATTHGTYIFSIEREKTSLYFNPDIAELQASIATLRDALTNVNAIYQKPKETYQQFSSVSWQLYQDYLADILGDEATKAEQLIIIPDGSLGYIPFEILVNESPDPKGDYLSLAYLLQQYIISYSYSSTLLLENIQRASQLKQYTRNKCLAFAPVYKETDKGGNNLPLDPLEETKKEIEGISQFFSGQYYLGEKAIEQNFKEDAGNYGLIHLAMHGLVNPSSPLYSQLRFSTSSDTTEDQMLHAYELYNLRLKSALVVLSACETGYGQYVRGEGIMSLARGFMYAGSPSVVMTLWKVEDKATAQIMQLFYKFLSQGQSKHKALQEAKMEYLSQADPLSGHPFFWASFVLMGESQGKVTSMNIPFWMLMGSILILIGIILLIIKMRRK